MTLEEISSKSNKRIAYRLSRVSANDDQCIADLGLDLKAREELLNFLAGRIPQDPIQELINGPFRPEVVLRRRTWFSDGSFPVFYSAPATEASEAEAAYWFRKEHVGKPQGNRTAYDQGFHCTFEGFGKDLRSRAPD